MKEFVTWDLIDEAVTDIAFNIQNTNIKIGAQADLTLFNPLTNYVFDEKDILSISKNSIFKNTSLKGIVYGIVANGKTSLNE